MSKKSIVPDETKGTSYWGGQVKTNPWAWSHGIVDTQHKWDKDFLELIDFWAQKKSKDPSTKTGAVIVRPDRTIVSMGYNGFAKDMRDDPELYADRETKYSRVIHCEMNALIFARQDVTGCTLYTTPFPSCDRCCVHMIQAGIKRMVAPALPDHLKERWGKSIEKTQAYCDEAGIPLVLI
jgi:dCMP deaminase